MSFKISVDKSHQNLADFKQNNQRAWEMLEELKTRCPWRRNIVRSLVGFVEFKGSLTAKQLSLITDMYLDNCAMSDDLINEQVDCRMLCFRLLDTNLGKMRNFISSIVQYTNERPFTQAQMKSVRKIVTWKDKELSQIKLGDFDGWTLKK